MRRTTAKRILLSVIVYDILIALLAYGVFGKSGTVYGKNRAAEEEAKEEEKKQEEEEKEAALEEDQADGSETSKIVVEDDTDDMTETGVDSMLAASEPTTIYKDWTDLYDAMGKLDTQESSDEGMSIMDFLPEEPEEPEPAPEPLYTFVTNNVETHLNMRDGPDLTDTIIHKLKPGTKGVVLELGDGWSHVTADGFTGYCSNDYLTMKEVTQEEYDSLKTEAEEGRKETSAGSKTQTAPAAEAGQAVQAPLSIPDGGQALQMPLTTPDAMQLPVTLPDGAQTPEGTDSSSQSSDSPDDDTDTPLDTEEVTDGTGQAAAAT
jgi:uncharacterized protein YgiM (DUF1202 family)